MMRNFRCAICGKQHGVTYNYRKLLLHLGIKGTRATMECVGNLPRPDFSKVALIYPRVIRDPLTGLILGPGA